MEFEINQQEENLHRKLMQEELEKQNCSICGSSFFELLIHHIDGNRKNNLKKNLICVCEKCHGKIHMGLSKKDYKLDNEIKDIILYYRAIYMKKKLKFNKSYIIEKLKLEKLKSIRKSCSIFCIAKKRCYICLKKKNLTYIYPKVANLSNENKKKYGIPFCKKCFKEMKIN